MKRLHVVHDTIRIHLVSCLALEFWYTKHINMIPSPGSTASLQPVFGVYKVVKLQKKSVDKKKIKGKKTGKWYK